MKAKEFLLQLKKLNRMIENKTNEKEVWESIAMSITAPLGGEKVQSSSNPNKMAEAIDKYIDIEQEMQKSIVQLWEKWGEIISVLEQLNEIEYEILHKMYVGVVRKEKNGDKKRYYFDFNDVSEHFNKSYSWATTMHGRALLNVQKILDERGDINEP